MAEPQPENPSSDNIFTALDLIGQTGTLLNNLAHTGGYKDKMRLGIALGRSGAAVRLAAKQHYHTERLQSLQKSLFVNYKYPAPSESINQSLQAIKYSPKGNLMPLHAPRRAMMYSIIERKVKGQREHRGNTYISDRFGKP